jgi:hypothetical protein
MERHAHTARAARSAIARVKRRARLMDSTAVSMVVPSSVNATADTAMITLSFVRVVGAEVGWSPSTRDPDACPP